MRAKEASHLLGITHRQFYRAKNTEPSLLYSMRHNKIERVTKERYELLVEIVDELQKHFFDLLKQVYFMENDASSGRKRRALWKNKCSLTKTSSPSDLIA